MRQIQQDLSKCDIVKEALSKYTSWSVSFYLVISDLSLVSRYPELRELEVRQLARSLLSVDSATTMQSLQKGIESYTRGQLPHATHVISTIYEFMESDYSVAAAEIPLPVATSSNKQTPSRDWAGLKKALISSLTSGTFLDSQFYAVESKSSSGLPKLRPIYFCSMVDDSIVSGLITCKFPAQIIYRRATESSFQVLRSSSGEKHPLNPQICMTVILRITRPTKDAPRTVTRVRDGSPSRYKLATLSLLHLLQRPGEPQPHRLTFGSGTCVELRSCEDVNIHTAQVYLYSTDLRYSWSAIFLYVYTGQVAFTAIVSQHVTHKGQNDYSQGETKDRGEVGAPPPGVIAFKSCSPKSIYSLANKVWPTLSLGDVDVNNTLLRSG